MKYLILFLITCTSYQVLGQQTTAKTEISADTTIYGDWEKLIESVPIYKGVHKYGMRYPGESESVPTVGEVVSEKLTGCKDCPSKSPYMFRIVVDQKGKVIDIEGVLPYAPEIGTECWKRANEAFLATSGDWTPAVRSGKNVRFRFNVKVNPPI